MTSLTKQKYQQYQLALSQIVQLPQAQKSINGSIKKNNCTSQIGQERVNRNPHYYRPEIDGLRTIAITIVIIFHAFPDFMPGGFIGVDVFFVISGYLISQIIIKQTKQQRFSYVNFYCRRIKRIYPALLLVLIFVLCVTLVFYGRIQLDLALKTSIASTIFGANFQVLAHQKGYFDPQIHVNPLLHLWSLGVQEQFYIFWPCLISIGLNAFKKRTFFVLSAYTVFSFVFSIGSIYNSSKFAFYFPLCRFWQMAIGGLVAYLSCKIQNTKITNLLSIVGTSSILITVWIINEQSLFPGFWALIPTLASAAIIQAGSEPFINKHILSSKIFVFVGKISYPMYLWHWPLLVFSRYLYPQGSISIFSNLYFVIFMTVLLSIATYYLIENPVRKMKTKKIVVCLLIFMMVFCCVNYFIFKVARDKNNFYDGKDIQSLLLKAENEIKPRPQEDFLQKNGKMHPNLSKSRNRKLPTLEKIKVSNWQIEYYFEKNNQQIILDKNIVQGSKYYTKNQSFLNLFQTANQGQQNQVFLIGDSHALRLSHRFQQLYRDSVSLNKTNEFPTIVSIIKTGYALAKSNPLLNFSMQMIKKHKPKRILMLSHWPIYYCQNPQLQRQPKCQYEEFQSDVKNLVKFMNQAQQLGVQVSTITINFQHLHLSAKNMIDIFGIIQENTKSISRKQYRIKFKRMFDFYETEMKNAGVDLIDLADNLCFQDNCEVVSPQGYSIYTDDHHFSKYYSRHWLSVVDHLVQF